MIYRKKSRSFNYDLDFEQINFREHPELYQIGRGEQGVLLIEPYKSEILPHWRFKTPQIAQKSADTIYTLFMQYKEHRDFVGMDMARKFLQMGYTRSRRYANHSSGKKYLSNPQKEMNKRDEQKARKNILPQAKDWKDSEKAESARIFYGKYLLAKNDPEYQNMKKQHQEKYL